MKDKDGQKEKKNDARISVLFVLGVFVIATWIASLGLMKILIEPQDRGEFGDQFGAVNALFSGLAFAGLIYTIYVQRIEIKQTQEEMREQNETFALQRFESSFFSMLSQHNEMVRNLAYSPTSDNSLRGRDIIRYFVHKSGCLSNNGGLLNKICTTIRIHLIEGENQKLEQINSHYDDVYNKRPNFFGIYYRSLYRIFIFIDNSSIENKNMYADIIRSQLSDDEILMLLVNGLSKKGEKFKTYIEKYSLLDNLPENEDIEVIKSLYSPSAYGEK